MTVLFLLIALASAQDPEPSAAPEPVDAPVPAVDEAPVPAPTTEPPPTEPTPPPTEPDTATAPGPEPEPTLTPPVPAPDPAPAAPATPEPVVPEPDVLEPKVDTAPPDTGEPAAAPPAAPAPAVPAPAEPATPPAPAAPPADDLTGWPLYLLQPEPAPAPDPGVGTPRVVQPVVSFDLAERILPWLPMRGVRNGLLLLFLTLLSALAASLTGRLKRGLRPRGVLPRTLAAIQLALRVVVVFFGLGVVAAFIPRSIAPALPLVVLAGAVAVGWSARDFLPDLVAGVLLALEDRIRPGQWIAGDEFAGVVEIVGLRATWLRDTMGRQVQVPNRRLLDAPVTADVDRWPLVDVPIDLRTDRDSHAIREILLEAVLLCPWLAPGHDPVIVRETDAPGRWRVRARVLSGRYADRLEGALHERVEEALPRDRRAHAPSEPPEL